MSLIIFKSKLKQTQFAPEWKYYMYEQLINDVDFDEVSKFILDKEKEIINDNEPTKRGDQYTDGNTGLGLDSLTARFERFNVFNWQNNEIQKLKNHILKTHEKFLHAVNFEMPKELYINCWANVMRQGQQIKPHIHDLMPTSYLGGHITIQCKDTFTKYINPLHSYYNDSETYESQNVPGKITLFQNFIPHYTDIHNDIKERITIAFNLYIHKEATTPNFLRLI